MEESSKTLLEQPVRIGKRFLCRQSRGGHKDLFALGERKELDKGASCFLFGGSTPVSSTEERSHPLPDFGQEKGKKKGLKEKKLIRRQASDGLAIAGEPTRAGVG